MMKIYIRSTVGHGLNHTFDVEPTTTIFELKRLFCEKADLKKSLPSICLLSSKEELEDDHQTLLDYEISTGTQLNAVNMITDARYDMGRLGSRFINVTDTQSLKRVEFSSETTKERSSSLDENDELEEDQEQSSGRSSIRHSQAPASRESKKGVSQDTRNILEERSNEYCMRNVLLLPFYHVQVCCFVYLFLCSALSFLYIYVTWCLKILISISYDFSDWKFRF